MTQALNNLINILKGHNVFIQTHNFPDPDAIASAFGVQKLLSLFGITANICAKGRIAKASAKSLTESFGIEISQIEDISDMKKDDYVLTVDSQPNSGNIAKAAGTVVACIDHHPTTVSYDYLFKDVQICGACATIVADYFFENDLPLDEPTATVLLYGLKMDTDNFTRRVTEKDIEIFGKLFKIANDEKLHTLSNQQMEFSELKEYTKALGNIKVFENVGFCFINGQVTDGFIASICDFMLTLVEVEFAIAYGYRGNGLKLSVRSENDYLGAGTITSNALEGIGSGGGHSAMAGGYISFDNLANAEFNLEEEIQNRFINAVYFSKMLKDALDDPFS